MKKGCSEAMRKIPCSHNHPLHHFILQEEFIFHADQPLKAKHDILPIHYTTVFWKDSNTEDQES